MPKIGAIVARVWRRTSVMYSVICARDEARQRGIRTPLGVRFCEHCRLVMWERAAFMRHARMHAV